jgi:hypothetical protein
MLGFIMATFTTPETIGTDAKSFFWLLPLAAAIASVYKALKLKEISAQNFVKETLILFGTIILFMAMVAIALYAVACLFTE